MLEYQLPREILVVIDMLEVQTLLGKPRSDIFGQLFTSRMFIEIDRQRTAECDIELHSVNLETVPLLKPLTAFNVHSIATYHELAVLASKAPHFLRNNFHKPCSHVACGLSA